MRLRSTVLLATLVGSSMACDKGSETVTPDAAAAPVDEHGCDKAATTLVAS